MKISPCELTLHRQNKELINMKLSILIFSKHLVMKKRSTKLISGSTDLHLYFGEGIFLTLMIYMFIVVRLSDKLYLSTHVL